MRCIIITKDRFTLISISSSLHPLRKKKCMEQKKNKSNYLTDTQVKCERNENECKIRLAVCHKRRKRKVSEKKMLNRFLVEATRCNQSMFDKCINIYCTKV